jgi:hypothetical protein
LTRSSATTTEMIRGLWRSSSRGEVSAPGPAAGADAIERTIGLQRRSRCIAGRHCEIRVAAFENLVT